MAIKAKLKRYNNGEWEQYFPQTSLEEEIVTLPAASWSGTGPATQTVSVQGLKEEDKVIIDLSHSGQYQEDTEQFVEFAKVYRIIVQDNAIQAFAITAPEVDIDIKVLVIF